MAEAKGYYADEGLDVELMGGGFDEDGNFISPVDKVLSGEADFGVLSGDLLLANRAEGKPLVAIASIYQRSPAAFASLAKNNIKRPSDLVGKTVMIDLGSATGLVYKALLSSQGIDYDREMLLNISEDYVSYSKGCYLGQARQACRDEKGARSGQGYESWLVFGDAALSRFSQSAEFSVDSIKSWGKISNDIYL